MMTANSENTGIDANIHGYFGTNRSKLEYPKALTLCH